MADNRNFFDHIQNEGGAPVYVEDKKLAETTSQSSLAATDSVMLKGTDGTFHAIDKSSFDEAVRASMGSILAQIDKTTNVSRIPVLGTDSNDLGSTTPANLATLLGVLKGAKSIIYLDNSADITYLDYGVYQWHNSGFLIVFGNPGTGLNGISFQILINADITMTPPHPTTLQIRFKWSGWNTWSNWVTI